MRKLVIYLLFIIAFSILHPVSAADITVTCASGGPCTMAPAPNEPLFFEKNILPGESVTRTLTIVNNNETDDCPAYIDSKNETDPDALAERLFTVVKNGAIDLYGVRNGSSASANKTLSNFFTLGSLYLGAVPPGGSKQFDWTVTFDPLAGNQYQKKTTVFDFDITISCGIPPTPTPTPPGSTDGGGGGTNTSTSGGGGTTTTFTPPIIQLFTTLPELFFPEPLAVAGAQTEELPSLPPEGEVMGTTACTTCIWWQILLVEAVVLSLHYYLTRKKHRKAFWIGGVIQAILIYIFFLWVNRSCRAGWGLILFTSNFWCRYFLLWDILVFIGFSFLFRSKKE